MWNIDQPTPRMTAKTAAKPLVAASNHSSKKMISPAYMLPNSRSECDSGLETYSMKLNIRLKGHSSGLEPNGAQKSSCTQPPRPLAEIEKPIISSQTDSASAKVVFTSAVGTMRNAWTWNTSSSTQPTISTGRKSIEFITSTQTNTVSAAGATKRFRSP